LKFSALQLAEPIVRAVTDKGYSSATDIQSQAIPPALLGRDILGTAQTGTGKTCAFALPILNRLSQSKPVQPVRNKRHDRRAKGRSPRALVLCPTRELATQIHESFIDYGSNLKLGYCVVFGGVSQYHQVRALQHGVDVLVATPGRLKDLYDQGLIDLSRIETLVLDEADRMLDMGFIADIRHIVQLIPADRQNMLFSATISDSIRRLANDLLDDPAIIETAPEATTVDTINQRFFMVPQQKKFRLLITLMNTEEIGRTLIFTKTKYKADRVARWLQRAGIRADAIHSNKTQSARNAAMRSFREGHINVLVATDIASRGIDVDNITHVLNFDVPIDPETYVHRIGRTARAGASGTAITFFQANEKQMLRAIERRADIQLPPAEPLPRLEEMPELTPDTTGSSRQENRQSTSRRERSDRHDRGSSKPGGHKKKFKKNKYQKSSGSTGGYTPRDDRDGNSGGYKKKDFKKNAGAHSQGNYVPREDRGGDSDTPGAYKKKDFKKNKFKKNAGVHSQGSYVPRDDRDGDSGKPGGYKKKNFKKKKFKKNAGRSNQGGYVSRDGDSGKPGGFKKKTFKKNGVRKRGMSGGSKGHRKGQSRKKFAGAN